MFESSIHHRLTFLIAAVAFHCLLIEGVSAQPSNVVATVHVEVNGNDEKVKNRLLSGLSNKLRSLQGVEVTDSNPAFRIRIIAAPIKTQEGKIVGHSLSVVVTKPDKKGKSQESKETLLLHTVLSANDADMQAIVDQLIADIDVKYIEPLRKKK